MQYAKFLQRWQREQARAEGGGEEEEEEEEEGEEEEVVEEAEGMKLHLSTRSGTGYAGVALHRNMDGDHDGFYQVGVLALPLMASLS